MLPSIIINLYQLSNSKYKHPRRQCYITLVFIGLMEFLLQYNHVTALEVFSA